MFKVEVHIKGQKSPYIIEQSDRRVAVSKAQHILVDGLRIGDNKDDIITFIPASQIVKCVVRE